LCHEAARQAAWLADLRQALGTAEHLASQLLDDRGSALEALELLARMADIRSELDVLQNSDPVYGSEPFTPEWTDLPRSSH
jgi:hypothetical protein